MTTHAVSRQPEQPSVNGSGSQPRACRHGRHFYRLGVDVACGACFALEAMILEPNAGRTIHATSCARAAAGGHAHVECAGLGACFFLFCGCRTVNTLQRRDGSGHVLAKEDKHNLRIGAQRNQHIDDAAAAASEQADV